MPATTRITHTTHAHDNLLSYPTEAGPSLSHPYPTTTRSPVFRRGISRHPHSPRIVQLQPWPPTRILNLVQGVRGCRFFVSLGWGNWFQPESTLRPLERGEFRPKSSTYRDGYVRYTCVSTESDDQGLHECLRRRLCYRVPSCTRLPGNCDLVAAKPESHEDTAVSQKLVFVI